MPALLPQEGLHGTFVGYSLQWAGSALLHLTRTHSTLPCYTLQWAGPVPQRPNKSLSACFVVLLQAEGGWACTAAPKGIKWHVAFLRLLCCTLQRAGLRCCARRDCMVHCFATRCRVLSLRCCTRRDHMVHCFAILCSVLGLRCCARQESMVRCLATLCSGLGLRHCA